MSPATTLKRIRASAGYVYLFLSLTGVAHGDTDPDTLFTSHETLEVRLEAPLKTIMRERPDEEYVPGKLQYFDAAGNLFEFDVGIRTRGKFRRDKKHCAFAPLRLNFRKSQVKDTIFDKQDKIKVVTHCQNNPRYQQTVLREYLAYRVLNLLTDVSFRARLLRVTYVDTDRNDVEKVSFAVILEHADRMARRIDMSAVKISMILFSDLHPEYANLMSLFHYFIGNTDFSQIAATPNEDCCHNHALFANEEGPYYSVPYDFDMSGFVGAPHAQPNPRFRLRSVRQRLYRGRCANNAHLPASTQRFIELRKEIYALINEQDLTASSRRSLLDFVDRFYKSLDSQKKIEKELVKKCI